MLASFYVSAQQLRFETGVQADDYVSQISTTLKLTPDAVNWSFGAQMFHRLIMTPDIDSTLYYENCLGAGVAYGWTSVSSNKFGFKLSLLGRFSTNNFDRDELADFMAGIYVRLKKTDDGWEQQFIYPWLNFDVDFAAVNGLYQYDFKSGIEFEGLTDNELHEFFIESTGHNYMGDKYLDSGWHLLGFGTSYQYQINRRKSQWIGIGTTIGRAFYDGRDEFGFELEISARF